MYDARIKVRRENQVDKNIERKWKLGLWVI